MVEYDNELSQCPLCGCDLVYQPSYDNTDLYMYCIACNFKGVVRNLYVEEDCEEK